MTYDASEWKPGDVAIVSSDFIPPERRIYGEYPPGENGCWYVGHGGFVRAENVTEVRPLVVIDPEDAEQVERLAKVYLDAIPAGLSGTAAELMRTALREFARPTPRIEEPTGLGAVVEDAEGRLWLRIFGDRGFLVWRSEVRDTCPARFDEIDTVRILSPGVPS